jgi:hypothetical protein
MFHVTCSLTSLELMVEGLSREMDMRKSRFSESAIIGIIREEEAGAKVAYLCRRHGISVPTLNT